MTDLAKAVAFATHCLKWTDVSTAENMRGTLICDDTAGSILSFNPDSTEDLEAVLREFLGKRYFIQINRGTTSLFQWRVIVGWQDGTDKSKSLDNAVGVGEDLWDAIFDACVQAASL
jgi:hypothetical protein